MGKYSNVNASSLSNAVTKALNELNQYSLQDIRRDLQNQNILKTSINSVLDSSFEKVISSTAINGSITTLKKKLNNLKNAANYINKYQNTEKEIEKLKDKLYKSDGTKNYSIQNRINTMKNTLNNYENKIDQYLS